MAGLARSTVVCLLGQSVESEAGVYCAVRGSSLTYVLCNVTSSICMELPPSLSAWHANY